MRNRFRGTVLLGVLACLVLVVQAVLIARPQGAAAPAYRAPRTADGKPNLSGIWQSMNEANWNIEAHSADFPRMLHDGSCGRNASGSRNC